MTLVLASRPNVYSSSPLDRAGTRREDTDWIAEQLEAPDTLFVPVWRSRNVDLDRPAAEAGLELLRRGGDFADGVIRHDASRARCRHIVAFDQDLADLLGRDHAVLLGAAPA